jgi:carbon-monoxide dehydrogenase medium subunit
MECCLVGIAVYTGSNPDDNTVADFRIALAASAPTPIRISQAEKLLEGQVPTEERIQNVAKLVRETSTPITDVRASKEYRAEMVEVLAARAISETISRLKTV